MKTKKLRPMIGKVLAGILLVLAQVVSDYYTVYLYDKWEIISLYLLWWLSWMVAVITGIFVMMYVFKYVGKSWRKIFHYDDN
jgi:hypothetical protein